MTTAAPSIWSRLWGAFSGMFGGGGIVSAVGSGLALADDVVKGENQRDLEAGGAAKQRDVNDEAVIKNVHDGNAAARSEPIADLVRKRDEVP